MEENGPQKVGVCVFLGTFLAAVDFQGDKMTWLRETSPGHLCSGLSPELFPGVAKERMGCLV